MIERVLRYDRCYLGKKDGKIHPSENFYAVIKVNDDERKVAIKPTFAQGLQVLRLVAKTFEVGDKMNPTLAPSKVEEE